MSTIATDRWGCPVTADRHEAETIDAAIAGYVTMAPGVDQHFAALEAGGPMAKTLLAQFLVQAHRAPTTAKAAALVTEARAEAGDVTERERGHIEATTAWVQGDVAGTMAALDRVVTAQPTDVLALRTLYSLLFTTGRATDMVDLIRRVRPAWSDDLPLVSLLDGHEAFGLEESGRYREAETLGRRGVERDPTDLWAIHAVAHVLEMEERRVEGASWLDGREAVLEAAGSFSRHLWWHQALQLLALGRLDEVLDLLDRRVHLPGSEEGLDLTNAISLLTRLETRGIDIGDRWQALAEPCTARRGHHSHPFNDTHYALALARAERSDDLAAHLSGLTSWSEGEGRAAEVLRLVGLATARGLAAWGQGQWSEAAAELEPVAGETWRLGGSHAQRDVYRQVLDHARAQAAS